MKVSITIELSDQELRVLCEICLYCDDGGYGHRLMPVTKLYRQYKVDGSTVSKLVNERLIEGSPHIIMGDTLSEHDVYPTSVGKEVVKAAKKMLKVI